MNLEGLIAAAPTHSFDGSRALLLEIMQRTDWRCYSSKAGVDTKPLVERYLQHHARVPGVLRHDALALIPAAVLEMQDPDGTSYKGALFMNGAVLLIQHPGELVYTLFIEHDTAERWGYPTEGHTTIGTLFEEAAREER